MVTQLLKLIVAQLLKLLIIHSPSLLGVVLFIDYYSIWGNLNHLDTTFFFVG